MREAARIHAKTVDDLVDTRVTSETFRAWWLGANENIQSSKSGCHFAHYMAAAENKWLTALHVAKLNLALETGVPLDRWGHGLT